MSENIISILLLALCAIRTTSYAVFTFKQKNKSGAVGIMLLLAAAIVCGIVFVI